MNGRFLLDTNAVIALLKGHEGLVHVLRTATGVSVPVIVELEFFSFPNLSASDELLFARFKSRIEVTDLIATNTDLMKEIIQIRRNFNLKLPDSIIAACAIQQQATLLSNDATFQRVSGLSLQTF